MVRRDAVPLDPREHVGPLLARFRRLRREDLEALDRSVQELVAAEGRRHRSDLGFRYAWYEGPPLSYAETAAMDALFTDVCAAIATGVTGFDAAAFDEGENDRAGAFGFLTRWFTPPYAKGSHEDAALEVLTVACRPFDPRRAVVACWNLTCAAAMRGHLAPEVIVALEAAWRGALGELPEERAGPRS